MKPQANLSLFLPGVFGIALILTVLVTVQPVPSKIEVRIPPPCVNDDCLPSDVPLTLRSQRSTEFELLLQKEGKR